MGCIVVMATPAANAIINAWNKEGVYAC